MNIKVGNINLPCSYQLLNKNDVFEKDDYVVSIYDQWRLDDHSTTLSWKPLYPGSVYIGEPLKQEITLCDKTGSRIKTGMHPSYIIACRKMKTADELEAQNNNTFESDVIGKLVKVGDSFFWIPDSVTPTTNMIVIQTSITQAKAEFVIADVYHRMKTITTAFNQARGNLFDKKLNNVIELKIEEMLRIGYDTLKAKIL